MHLIVLIFGFTGILGKLIELPSNHIVIYRTIIACITIALYLRLSKTSLNAPSTQIKKWVLTGFVVGLHWFFFFESIKLSTVSIALVSFSSTSLFTSIIEPIFRKKRPEWYEFLFSIMIIIGMALVLSFEFKYAKGIFFGIIGAFLASLFTVLNSKFVEEAKPSLISLYELMGGAGIILLLSLMIDPGSFSVNIPILTDVIYLLLLGIVATAFAFVVAVQIMKKLSPFTVSLTINLEPLYGIILSVLIFGQEEMMSTGFYVGFGIILFTLLANAYFKKMKRSKGDEIIKNKKRIDK